jgi:molecular chaperone DnaK (HSP70)
MSESKYVYGIDLGTTYSCIAYQDETGRPVVLKNLDNESTTPSVVQFPDEGGVIVGKQAKDTSVMYPKHTISLVKQLMGRTKVAYTNREGIDISPSEISAFILKKLAGDAGKINMDTVSNVVITVPAYFGENEREATKEAGRLAGLNVLSIIEEPTAAAIYYGCTKNGTEKTILVYDLGGGTFDITIMKITGDEIRVICTDGDHDLGGQKWDKALSRWVIDTFVEKTNFSDDFDEEAHQEVALFVEDVKKQLSKRTVVKKMLNIHGLRETIEVTRELFDDLTISTLLSSTITKTLSTIELAKAHPINPITHIDEILLVGGSTHMPQVAETIKAQIGMDPKILEPDEAVAKGAAIHAVFMLEAYKNGTMALPGADSDDDSAPRISLPSAVDSVAPVGGPTKVISASTKSFGLQVFIDNELKIYNMILKDQELPINVQETFGTQHENQASVEIKIYESTYYDKQYDIDESFYKGQAVLSLPPNTPKHSPIEITMILTDDGTLKFKGVNPKTGEECKGEFQGEYAMKKEEFIEAQERVASLVKMSDNF